MYIFICAYKFIRISFALFDTTIRYLTIVINRAFSHLIIKMGMCIGMCIMVIDVGLCTLYDIGVGVFSFVFFSRLSNPIKTYMLVIAIISMVNVLVSIDKKCCITTKWLIFPALLSAAIYVANGVLQILIIQAVSYLKWSITFVVFDFLFAVLNAGLTCVDLDSYETRGPFGINME